ncbi:MAG: hypothetical protein KatS3mg021_0088 [Fimbriimonadales bacterium]|nr:MAG: hypothetical protein KatS3mg021_0088 [Fimbriimonadales bacterium]
MRLYYITFSKPEEAEAVGRALLEQRLRGVCELVPHHLRLPVEGRNCAGA